jgi:hypothetical protein
MHILTPDLDRVSLNLPLITGGTALKYRFACTTILAILLTIVQRMIAVKQVK